MKKLLQLYGLKWNPFGQEVPTEALSWTPRLESFGWRLEHLARDGGFAAVIGDPGTGKSSTMRLAADRLGRLRDVVVGAITRPQAGVADFYREMGDLFSVPLVPHNRWAGAKALRETWRGHIQSSLLRPVLLFDEAQEAKPEVLHELRLLASADLDARSILAVVFAGDRCFQEMLRRPDLLPLDSRLRPKLLLEAASREELSLVLRNAMDKAGTPKLMTPELVSTLVEHAAGNLRAVMQMANDLLLTAAEREADKLDEKLYFEVLAAGVPTDKPRAAKPAGQQKLLMR